MAIGAGKYDDICTNVRNATDAEGVIILVFDGNRGTGYSAQLPLHLTLTAPGLLRNLANDIETTIRQGQL